MTSFNYETSLVRSRANSWSVIDPDFLSRSSFSISMLAHGFTVDMLVELATARLATAQTEHMVAGGRPVEVIRFRTTEAGRRALSPLRWP